MKINFVKLVAAILISELAGIIGSVFTFPSIQTWYATLSKPSFSPPNWVFGPVWTVLYFLMGISLYLVWQRGWKNKNVKIAVKIFAIQLILNSLWSILFFELHSPFYAFIEIILLWLAIVFTIYKFYRISKNAAYLLIPYLFWVSFAAFLNYFVLILNL